MNERTKKNQIMKNRTSVGNLPHQKDVPFLLDNCVIKVPGANFSVPAVFKSWIYGETKSDAAGSLEVRGVPMKRKKANIGLNSHLLDLVRLRIAQMHDCKVCTVEHTKSLKASGETDSRLRQIKDWRAKTVFSEREKAALSFAESLTENPIGAISDNVVHAAFFFFNETELLSLILVILAANDWHYLGGFHNRKKTRRPPHE
jgi:AhpD family alkylhydroperoxidase